MLDREARELEFEIRRQEMEMETQRRLAELRERQNLQGIRARLEAAQLSEEISEESDEDQDVERSQELPEQIEKPCAPKPGPVSSHPQAMRESPAKSRIQNSPSPVVPQVFPQEQGRASQRPTEQRAGNLEATRDQIQSRSWEDQGHPLNDYRPPAPETEFPVPQQTFPSLFQQQQQALRLMAETIGASISKGFEMPKRQYMEFDGNPMNYLSQLLCKTSNTILAVISRATLSNSMLNSLCAWNRMCKLVRRTQNWIERVI